MFLFHIIDRRIILWSLMSKERKKMNPFLKKLAKVAYNIGDHNDPLNAVLAIAIFKGINRPLFTMMDKESDPQTKKYAAFREGLTEVIAALTYVATNKILVNPLTNFLHRKTGGHKGRIKNALEFICVCLSAVCLIPAACNLTLNPVMKGIAKLQKKKAHDDKTPKLDIKETIVDEKAASNPVKRQPVFQGPNSLLTELQMKYTPNIGGNMKVGG